MSEDEKIIDNFKYWFETNTENGVSTIPDFICKKLLDLCQKEKEKNKFLKQRNEAISNNMLSLASNSLRKDKIREKIESIENTFEVCDEEINYRLKIEDKAKIEVLKELLED